MAEKPRFPGLDPDNRLPDVVVERFKLEHMKGAGLDVVGLAQAVIVASDTDVADIPNGTFIARLPEGF